MVIENSFEKGDLHLYQGNSEQILNTFENEFFDSIIIDPPYGYGDGAMEGKLKKVIDVDFNRRLIFEKITEKTKKDASFVIFGRGMNLYKDAVILEELGWIFKEEIVWNKMRNSQPYMKIHRTHELALVFMRGDKKINEVWMRDYYENVPNNTWYFNKLKTDYKNIIDAIMERGIDKVLSLVYEKDWKQSTVYLKKTGFFEGKRNVVARDDMDIYGAVKKRLKTIINVSRDVKTLHSTQKPVYLMRCLIELVSNENEKILDCFLGSGSTGIAALEANRQFYGIELNSEYYEIAKKRLIEIQKNKQGALF